MYTVTATIPFDMILDTDMGIWKLIQKRYPDDKVFYSTLLKIRDIERMKCIIVDRNKPNPLYALLREEYYSSADTLYSDFINKHYDEILSLSQKTGIFDLIRRSQTVSEVLRFLVLCKSTAEERELRKRFSKYDVEVSTRVITDLEHFDVSKFGSVYVKDYNDILNYTKVEGKNIIVGRYKFNFENGIENVPLKDVSLKMMPLNVIHFVDIYPLNKNKKPVG